MAEANVRLRVDGRDAVNQLNRVNKAAGTLQGTVGKLVGAFAGIQAAKFVFFKTAELETQTRSLKVLTGSLGNAQKIIKELQQFGAVTPFTSAELIETAKRLKAFGFETEKIVDVTKRLGDIAGATGADLGGIATAFGQIQAKGRLQGEELLQLQERGVDLQGTLRKEYGLTAEEFQKALSKGQIGADAVSFALEKLTEKGGKYADGAIAQSDTLNGKLSTLTDSIDGIARSLGEILSPALKDIFDLAIATTNAINEAFAARSITTREKQAFEQEAVREVQAAGGGFGVGNVVVRHLGKTYQGPPDQVIRQITNDLINKEVQRRAGSQALAASTANAATAVATRPELGGGTTSSGGTTSERVDASKELVALNERLFGSTEQLSELEKINLEFQIQRQQILDRDLGVNEEKIALLQAQAGFEADLLGYREDQLKLQQDAADLAERERKKREAEEKRRREADPGFQMKQQLEELIKLENQVAAGATAIGNAFSNSLKAVVTGSKSAEQALADMMASVAEHFLDMAAQIIAQQIAMIIYGTIMKALGVGLSGGGGASSVPGSAYGDMSVAGPSFFSGGMIPGFAEGGYVSKPTNALIGEGGEPEYVIPQSKMRESMARFSAGARGSSVIPGKGNGGGYGESMSGGGGTVVNYNGPTLNFNSEDYVPASAIPGILDEATKRGAKAGEARTFATLRNSRSQRSKLGL